MEKVIEERIRELEKAINEARGFASCVSEKLGKTTVILYGSYARGDFNEWSDIDVLVVAENLPRSPIERLSLVEDCMKRYAGIEPLLVALDDLHRMKGKNPAVDEALERGIILADELAVYVKGGSPSTFSKVSPRGLLLGLF